MYAVSAEDHDAVVAESRQISARCKKYREAYREMRELNERLTIDAQKDKQAALAKQDEELMLLRAQLRAREEENQVIRAKSDAQARDMEEIRAAFELFKSQVAAKDGVIADLTERLSSVRQYNVTLMIEMRRLNCQLAAEGDVSEAGRKVEELSAHLERARRQHNSYEIALKIMQERIWELEKRNKQNHG
jgi:chromosome segregation ATPase